MLRPGLGKEATVYYGTATTDMHGSEYNPPPRPNVGGVSTMNRSRDGFSASKGVQRQWSKLWTKASNT